MKLLIGILFSVYAIVGLCDSFSSGPSGFKLIKAKDFTGIQKIITADGYEFVISSMSKDDTDLRLQLFHNSKFIKTGIYDLSSILIFKNRKKFYFSVSDGNVDHPRDQKNGVYLYDLDSGQFKKLSEGKSDSSIFKIIGFDQKFMIYEEVKELDGSRGKPQIQTHRINIM